MLMCWKARDYMKDFSQYGNRPDDQWEMLPWIPDPRPPFKIWVKPEQIAPFFLIPHHPYAISLLLKINDGFRTEEFRRLGLTGSLSLIHILGNFSAVGGFRELTNLSTFDLFGFGADDIPTPEQMPELRWFWMTSLPETAAKAAKPFWKSKPGMDLRITKPRKPEGLAQNLDNPFRGWDGAEHIPASAAKKAANQYRKTRSQLMKLAAEPGEDAQAQALEAVAAYTQTFNKMGFIETEERDEIYMALRGILDALPGDMLQKDALIEHFDHVRDF